MNKATDSFLTAGLAAVTLLATSTMTTAETIYVTPVVAHGERHEIMSLTPYNIYLADEGPGRTMADKELVGTNLSGDSLINTGDKAHICILTGLFQGYLCRGVSEIVFSSGGVWRPVVTVEEVQE